MRAQQDCIQAEEIGNRNRGHLTSVRTQEEQIRAKKDVKETEIKWHRCVRRSLKMKDILETLHQNKLQGIIVGCHMVIFWF